MVGGFKALPAAEAFAGSGCRVILQPVVDELDHVGRTERFQTCQGASLYELLEAAQVSETTPDALIRIAMSFEVRRVFVDPGAQVQKGVWLHGFRGPSNPSSCCRLFHSEEVRGFDLESGEFFFPGW